MIPSPSEPVIPQRPGTGFYRILAVAASIAVFALILLRSPEEDVQVLDIERTLIQMLEDEDPNQLWNENSFDVIIDYETGDVIFPS